MPDLTVRDFLLCISVGKDFNAYTFNAIRDMLNIDLATNTNMDEEETERIILDFFCVDEDVMFDRLEGGALCRPYRSFKDSKLRLDDKLQAYDEIFPFPENGVPVTDTVHELTLELLNNYNARIQLANYFAVLNDAARDIKAFMTHIESNFSGLLDQFHNELKEKDDTYLTRKESDVFEYDCRDDTIGPKKLIGYALLFGIRPFSLVLLNALSLGTPGSFNFFMSEATIPGEGRSVNYCPAYYDQETMEISYLGSLNVDDVVQNRCFLTEYFKSVLNFLQFDAEYEPGISPQIYMFIMQIIERIAPLLDEYESMYGWRCREYNPCAEIRSIIAKILSYSWNIVQRAPDVFCEEFELPDILDCDISREEVCTKLNDMNDAISALQTQKDLTELEELLESIVRMAVLNSDDYIKAFLESFGIRDGSITYKTLWQQLMQSYSQNNGFLCFYVYGGFLRSFVPFSSRYFVATLRFARFLYSDEVRRFDLDTEHLIRARRGCCSGLRFSGGNVFEEVRKRIIMIEAQLDKPVQMVNEELFINMFFDAVEATEEIVMLAGQTAQSCLEYDDMQVTNLLEDLRGNSDFIEEVTEALGENWIVSEEQLEDISRLKRIEVEMLENELVALSELCEQRIPELSALVGERRLESLQEASEGLELFLSRSIGSPMLSLFNFLLHSPGVSVQRVGSISGFLLSLDKCSQFSETASTVSVEDLAFAMRLDDAGRYYTVKDVFPVFRMAKTGVFKSYTTTLEEQALYTILYVQNARTYDTILMRYQPVRPCVLIGQPCKDCEEYNIMHYDHVSGYFNAFLEECYNAAGVSIRRLQGTADLCAIALATCQEWDCRHIVADSVLIPLFEHFDLSNLTAAERNIAIRNAAISDVLNCPKIVSTYAKEPKKALKNEKFFNQLLQHYIAQDGDNCRLSAALEFIENSSDPEINDIKVLLTPPPNGCFVYITQTYTYGARFLPSAAAVICCDRLLSRYISPVSDITLHASHVSLQQFCKLLFLNTERIKANMEGESVTLTQCEGSVFLGDTVVSTTTSYLFEKATFDHDAFQIRISSSLLEEYIKAFFALNICNHTSMATIENANPSNLQKNVQYGRTIVSVPEQLLPLLTEFNNSSTYFVENCGETSFEMQIFFLYTRFLDEEFCEKMNTTFEKNKFKFVGRERKLVYDSIEHYLMVSPRHSILLALKSLFDAGEFGLLLDCVPRLILGSKHVTALEAQAKDAILYVE